MKILSLYILTLLAILSWNSNLTCSREELYSMYSPVENDQNVPDHEQEDPEQAAADYDLRKEEKMTWIIRDFLISEPFTSVFVYNKNGWVETVFAPPEV